MRVPNSGLTTYRDAAGNERDAPRISILNYGGDRRVDYYIAPQPPYWIGMIARSWQGIPTSIVRIVDFGLRELSLSDHVDEFMALRQQD